MLSEVILILICRNIIDDIEQYILLFNVLKKDDIKSTVQRIIFLFVVKNKIITTRRVCCKHFDLRAIVRNKFIHCDTIRTVVDGQLSNGRGRVSRQHRLREKCCQRCIRLILFWDQLTRLKCYAIVLMGSNYLGMLL